MATYHYHTEFVPLPYRSDTKGLSIFKTRLPDSEPLVEQFLQSPEYLQRLESLGQAGWELVAVQPLWRAITPPGNDANGTAGTYTLPSGFLLFFKRQNRVPGSGVEV